MNILILSCGTRYKLVEFFKACERFESVIVTDCSAEAPALYVATRYYLVPRMKEEGYFDSLLEICRKERIDVVLPLHEEEIILIAENKERFLEQGVYPLISDAEMVRMCKDKYLLAKTLKEMDLPTVPTFLCSEYLSKDTVEQKMFVKPRFGAGSINTFAVKNRCTLEALAAEIDEELIVQPSISGREYGIDIYADIHSHKVTSIFCKEKLRMRAGETEKSVAVRNAKLEELAVSAVTKLGLIGPLDMDVLEENGALYILEINPRFGGGYPHAYLCGVDFPTYIAENIAGETKDELVVCYQEGIVGMKYSDIICK